MGPKKILLARHYIIQSIREYFCKKGLLEVQVPTVAKSAIPEASIDLFDIETIGENYYLLPSPELHLKPLLTYGFKGFFYLGPAFRKGELGNIHMPEFTILEWYRAQANYEVLIEDCQELLLKCFFCLRKFFKEDREDIELKLDLSGSFQVFTIANIFQTLAGWNPLEIEDPDRFDEDMAFVIEPGLPEKRPVFLKDYPIWACSLAKINEGPPPYAERIELYLDRTEIANGFSELVDNIELKERFLKENKKRIAQGLKPVKISDAFLKAMEKCPQSAGMALGIDRLLMVLLGLTHIKDTYGYIQTEF